MHGNRLQVIGGFSIVPPPAPTILSVQLHTTPLFCVSSVVDIDLVPAEDGDVILVGELTYAEEAIGYSLDCVSSLCLLF